MLQPWCEIENSGIWLSGTSCGLTTVNCRIDDECYTVKFNCCDAIGGDIDPTYCSGSAVREESKEDERYSTSDQVCQSDEEVASPADEPCDEEEEAQSVDEE